MGKILLILNELRKRIMGTTEMEDYTKFRDLLYKFSNLGLEKSKETGAIKIGRAPHIAPLAVLNCIYPTIDDEQIKFIENEINRKLHLSLKQFLTNFSNGLGVLCNTMALFGLRSNYIRTIEMVWQPFNIIEYNKYELPQNATSEMVFIGGYEWDGSKLYMTSDGRVHYCDRWDATSLKSWDSLTKMLIEEIERLYAQFNEYGVQIDPKKPTTPLIL